MKKQPDKITAYYYRAANKQTDLNLDNQMHLLLSHAQENRSDTTDRIPICSSWTMGTAV